MKSVLLIDDNKLFSDTVQLILESEGYEVCCCDNGSQALGLLEDKSFCAAIVDYQLPGMNGVEITGMLRTTCPDALIIGFSLDHKEKEFLGAGADRFFPKPLINEVLSQLNELA